MPYGGDAPDDLTRQVASKSGEFTAVDTAADDVALFGPTSGSTGVPKITTHFHRDILSIDDTFGRNFLRLTPDDVEAITALAYVEMLERGFTRVGEFHYLHNDPSGETYADPAELAARDRKTSCRERVW